MSEILDPQRLVWTGFIRSYQKFPGRGAIEVAGHEVTYEQLAQRAKRLAGTIQGEVARGGVPLTAVFVYRSHTAYAAVLGALMAGHGYVPLKRTFPIDRTRLMLERSMCRSLIVDSGSEAQLSVLFRGIATPLLIVCPDRSDVTEFAAKFPVHRILGSNDLADAEQWRPAQGPQTRSLTCSLRQEARATKRCNRVPCQRAPLRRLRHKALRLHE
jgi:acyl-CoA synthetase (AMP-forming)/AMP-acid ligase II